MWNFQYIKSLLRSYLFYILKPTFFQHLHYEAILFFLQTHYDNPNLSSYIFSGPLGTETKFSWTE
jgi:hypothetical protein